MDHLFEPADEVAGDFFDVIRLNNEQTLFCVADVAGHGIASAMAASILKALLQEAVEYSNDPGKILERINAKYCRVMLPGHFATVAIFLLDVEQHWLGYASAGHEPAWLHMPDGSLSALCEGEIVVGVVDDQRYETVKTDVPPGTRLLVVSDGVTETFNPSGEAFGRQRVSALLAQVRGDENRTVIPRMAVELRRFREESRQLDDVTVLFVEC